MRTIGIAIGCLAVGVASAAQAAFVQGFQMSGQLGYELTGIAVPGTSMTPVSGAITLNNIMPGAIVQQVFLYTNDFSGAGSGGGWLDFAFSQAPAPAAGVANNVGPTSQDPGSGPLTYGWEIPLVPNSVIGNGSYNVQISESIIGGNANQMAGAGLLVIYSHPMLPTSTITVNHGVRMMGTNLQPSSASTTFNETSATIPAGTGNLSILTFADDPATSGETIDFNANTNIGGPLDANLPGGGSASVLNFTGLTTLGGGNDTVTLNSTGDIFGWHVAVLQSQVPEPSAFLLATLALVGLLGDGRRRHRS
jgi:hypothetical protein